MTSERKKVHEIYHKKTKSQYKIIKDKNFTYRHLIKYISKYLKKNYEILDIGCGAGTLDFYFADKGYRVTAIDISDKAIQSCKQTQKNLNLNNLNFKVADFQNTKIKGKFDFVIFTEVIEHLPSDDLALKSIYRLLKPGGILFLSTPSINAPLNRMGFTKDFDKKVGHLRRYSRKEITNLIKSNNFEIIEVIENEGIFRNFLFINDRVGKSIKFFKSYISDFITFVDNRSLKLFGESNYFVIATKKNV
jgi:ubiquinone biosynthesis O-methyltransferase